MERRFKKVLISMHEVTNHGKNFKLALDRSLPEGSQIMRQTEDLDSASIKLVVYNPEWTVVKDGERIPTFKVQLKEPEAYPH